MIIVKIVSIILAFTMLFSCKKEDSAPTNPIAAINPMCNPEVMSYNFGVEHYSIHNQVKLLDSLGMDGIMLRIAPSGGLNDLRLFYQTDLVQKDSFHVYDLFAYLSLADSLLYKEQIKIIDSIYQLIEFKETQLQVIFLGTNKDPSTAITQVADMALGYGKNLIIYPHYETSPIETAEEALVYIYSLNKSNVYLAVHLCHELAGGNANRIEEVITNVAPYIKSVSVSGASLSEFNDNSLPNWYWGIKPLYMGTYDLEPFYQSLYDVGYTGALAIHTWGIQNNFGIPSETHLPLSKAVIDQLASDVCE